MGSAVSSFGSSNSSWSLPFSLPFQSSSSTIAAVTLPTSTLESSNDNNNNSNHVDDDDDNDDDNNNNNGGAQKKTTKSIRRGKKITSSSKTKNRNRDRRLRQNRCVTENQNRKKVFKNEIKNESISSSSSSSSSTVATPSSDFYETVNTPPTTAAAAAEAVLLLPSAVSNNDDDTIIMTGSEKNNKHGKCSSSSSTGRVVTAPTRRVKHQRKAKQKNLAAGAGAAAVPSSELKKNRRSSSNTVNDRLEDDDDDDEGSKMVLGKDDNTSGTDASAAAAAATTTTSADGIKTDTVVTTTVGASDEATSDDTVVTTQRRPATASDFFARMAGDDYDHDENRHKGSLSSVFFPYALRRSFFPSKQQRQKQKMTRPSPPLPQKTAVTAGERPTTPGRDALLTTETTNDDFFQNTPSTTMPPPPPLPPSVLSTPAALVYHTEGSVLPTSPVKPATCYPRTSGKNDDEDTSTEPEPSTTKHELNFRTANDIITKTFVGDERRQQQQRQRAAQQAAPKTSSSSDSRSLDPQKIDTTETPQSNPSFDDKNSDVRFVHGMKVTMIDDDKKVFIIDVLPPQTCDYIRQIVDDHVDAIERKGGTAWRSLYTYTKMDLPCCEVKNLVSRVTDHIMADVIKVVGSLCGKRKEALRLRPRSWKEPHLLKYQKIEGLPTHTGIEMHYDGCDITWQLMLTRLDEYTGGGTYFRCLQKTIRLRQGQALIHPGELYHKGLHITGGMRLLLVSFMDGFDPKIVDDSKQKDDKEVYTKNVCTY